MLLNDLSGLINAPIRDDTRLRLSLLMYCHITEATPIYCVIDNMFSIIEGERYSFAPFHKLYTEDKKRDRLIPPSSRKLINHIKEHAAKLNESAIVDLLDWMFNYEVRNSFFHSDYVLTPDDFRMRNNCGGDSAPHTQKAMPLDELADIINRGLLFFQAFWEVHWDHKRSYKETKRVKGRFRANDGWMELDLLVHPDIGVTGFRSSTA